MTNLHLMKNEIWLSCVQNWTKRGGWKIPKTVKKSLQIAKIAGIYKYELFHHLTLVKAIKKVPNSFEAYQTEPRKLDLLPVRDLLSSPIITIIIHNPPILMISMSVAIKIKKFWRTEWSFLVPSYWKQPCQVISHHWNKNFFFSYI